MNRWLLCMTAAGCCSMTACSTPASVSGLLEMTDRVLEQEAAHLDADRERVQQHVKQSRQDIAAAFDRDLDAQEELNAQWVREAVQVYALAIDAMVRYELQLQAEYAIRRDNLDAGRQALQRAVDLMRMRDELLQESQSKLNRLMPERD